VIAKGIAGGILRFDDPVSVKQESVAQVEGNLANGIIGVRQDSEQEPVALDVLQPALPP
jgi:hypothetical protein